MDCTACGFAVSPDFAFCPKCGAKLPAACPSCGFAVSPEFAFCPKCGGALSAEAAPVAEAAAARTQNERGPPAAAPPAAGSAPSAPDAAARPEADRRPVTVLFADLSGFTALSERLDPEEVRALQTDLHTELTAVVHHYEGFVEKFVGDALLALFGAPVAHEDDPERALSAALAMRERMTVLESRWKGALGSALSLHIGVNTGPVVAGSLGSHGESAYAVTGDTVNTASRLLSAAETGEILVGPATWRLTRHAFLFEEVGPITVKGKQAPVTPYRLREPFETTRSARGLAAHGLTTPLIGRADEMKQMLGAFDQMLRGRAQVVRLVGDAGVGKSRLLDEVLARLSKDGKLDGVAIRKARCTSLGAQTYGVLGSMLRQAYGIDAAHDLEQASEKLAAGLRGLGADEDMVAQTIPLLARTLGLADPESGAETLEPEQLKRQIFLAARSLFELRLRDGPLLLLVEDLHWADAASVELLRFLADRLDDRPLMLLVTHRPTMDGTALMTSRTTQTAIRLAPLSGAECHALVGALFQSSEQATIPERVRDFVVERAGGNPFYLEELVRSLIESGMLVHAEPGWSGSAGAGSLDVPLTIQGLLLSRLDRLPGEARRVLQEASVLGAVFDAELLRALSGPGQELDLTLDTLRDAEFVEEVPGSATIAGAGAGAGRPYRFTQTLVQEVVYQNLLVRRRNELHARAGVALEKMCEGRPQRLEDVVALARHFSAGGDVDKGVRYLLEAGDRARALYANDDAVRHYQQALEVLDACEACDTERAAVRERLADLLGPAGRREEAEAHYRWVLEILSGSGDRIGQARIHRKMGALLWDGGARTGARASYEEGLALLDGQAEEIERAHLYHEMGRLAFRSGQNDEAIAWSERALALAEKLAGDAEASAAEEARRQAGAVASQAHNTLGVALARIGRLQDAVSHVEQSVAVADANALPLSACRGYTNLGVLYSTLDPERAIKTSLSGLTVAKKINDLGFQSRLYANLGAAYCTFTGRCEADGVSAVETAIELDRQLGLRDHLPVSLIVLGQIYQCHGDPERARACYTEALETAEEMAEPQLLFPCYDGLATLYLDQGDVERAEQYMEHAREVCEGAGLQSDSLLVLPFLC